MRNKNSILMGVLAAFIFPLIAFFVSNLLKENTYVINKPAVPYLVAIALNLIMVRVGMKKELDKTSRGIMLVTFAFMLLIFVLKIHPLK